MFKKLNVPLIGIVENMHFVTCNNCSNKMSVFGEGATTLAEELSCDILGKFPLHQAISYTSDTGTPFVVEDTESEITCTYKQVAEKIAIFLENNKK